MSHHGNSDIIFIRTIRPVLGDPRLWREAKALAEHGYTITILALDRESKHKGWEILEGARVKNFAVKLPSGKPSYIIAYYPVFWAWVFLNILIMKPRVIHACNLDAGVIGYICWKLGLCKKFVFDLFDGFALSFIPPRKKILFETIHAIENRLFYEADVGIVPSEARAKFYSRLGQKEVAVVLNSPPDSVRDLKKTNGIHKRFSIVYAGGIGRGRGILELVKATEGLGVDLILAGRVTDPLLLFESIRCQHVKYLGLLSYVESLNLEDTADCIVALYAPFTIIDRLAEPNKIYEAMMLGKPIISNVKRDILSEYKCGMSVNYGDIQELRNAIKFLKENTKVAYEMGTNGRKAYEKSFNWSKQRQKLIDTYRQLLNQT